MSFRAVLARQVDGKFEASIQHLEKTDLPPGEVLTRVLYSSLNYKDGLAVTGRPGVIRKFPMVPGIDYAGVVEESVSSRFQPGDQVVVTGCGTSESMWGGYAEYARLDAQYIVPLPSGITLQQSMAVGTAGFTAMQCVMALEAHGLRPGGRPVLVAGAAGGVGSVAVAILAKLGYHVVASTGRESLTDYLKELGAAEVVARESIAAPSKRPMDSERWAGAVDSVGGDTLAGVIRCLQQGSSVAACGLAGGAGLNTTVLPFILRGVAMYGIDSVMMPRGPREEAWRRLGTDLPLDKLDSTIGDAGLGDLPALAPKILKGEIRGRVVVDVNK